MPSYISPFTGDVIQPTDVSYASYTLSSNLQLEWPSNTEPTQSPAARILDITPTGAGFNLIMPPANQVSVGQDALIRNLGAYTFTVQDYTNGTIVAIPAGEAQYIYVTTNATTAGTWGVIAFGIGSSGADANALAGLGLLAISTTLNQSHPTSSLADLDTLASSDRAQTKIWYGGAGTVYLPTASTLGDNWFFLFKNNGTGTCTIETQLGETIDQQPSKTFQPDDSCIVVCDGTQYITVGYGQNVNFLFTALVKPVTSGSYVLTLPEATSIVQEYVGSLTGNVTVYYPPVVALYIVSNQTTDNGYTLEVTTGAGTPAIIPPGQQATLVCDGLNFFNANTVQAGGTSISLVDGTAGTPSLNFLLETSTGLYRPASGRIGISILGVEKVEISGNTFDASDLDITTTGTGTFEGGISGGTFN